MRSLKLAEQAAIVRIFNKAAPVGTIVRYWRGAREGEPSGQGPIYSPAAVTAGGDAVAWVERTYGCNACVALTHIEIVEEAEIAKPN